MTDPEHDAHIPRSPDDDYTSEAAARRRAFVEATTGARLDHVGRHSLDPSILPGNIENFIGVAQVPIGLAGPLRSRASTRVANSTFPWRRPRERWSRATTAACGCSPSAAGQGDGGRPVDAALPGLPLRRRARGARVRRMGRGEFRGDQDGGGDDDPLRQARVDPAVRGRADPSPAVQLHDRRRRRARTCPARRPMPPASGSG